MKTTVVGAYPKISDDPALPNLRNALNRHEQGKLSDDQLRLVYDQTVERVIKEQEQLGLDEITDGMIHWDDLADPFARRFGGMQRDGLLRFFDNNVYYRQPRITGPITFQSATVDYFVQARKLAMRPLKAVLPGPFTLASLSHDMYYKNDEKLTLALADALHQEALALEAAGASHIQFDEPSLCRSPHRLGLVHEALDIVTRGLSCITSVFLYFGSVGGLAAGLFSLPVHRVGIDCVSRPGNLEIVLSSYGGDKDIILGLVDARNTRMESEDTILAALKQVARRVPADKVWLSPSCGLEFLPHSKALAKLHLITRVVTRFNALSEQGII